MSRGKTRGFTLIEVIGAFFLTTVILITVTGLFIENGRQRSAATELMRVQTSAHAALDLLAQDLEAALYVAPRQGAPARDHPWRFLAERSGSLGSTLLRFPTQNVPRGNLGAQSSTWVEVVWFLSEDDEDPDRYTLWRWRSTRPPGDVDPPLPDPDDPGSARVARGVADFGVVFEDAEGATFDEWDSTASPAEAPLPVKAEIRLVLYRAARPGEAEGDELDVPGDEHARHVSLPMYRPIDLDALVQLALAGAAGETCATVGDCLAVSEDQWYTDLLQDGCDGDMELCDALQASGETCWTEIVDSWPEIAGQADPTCESLR